MTVHLKPEQKQMAIRLGTHGLDWKDIARAVGCSRQVAWRNGTGQTQKVFRPLPWQPREGRLTIDDREMIVIGLAQGVPYSAIARDIGKAPSTVSREVAANGGRNAYRAWGSYLRARECARRPKATKLTSRPVLLAEVVSGLEAFWSPEEISRRLHVDHPDDPMMRVSHETIYQSLFVQSRGELRRELTRCLRSGRVRRRKRSDLPYKGPIPDMINISERPAEVADRAVPGHWEGDLIIGKKNLSAVGTLVERSTRFTLLLRLEDGQTPLSVNQAMKKAISTLPKELVKTITWDQGREMSHHKAFTIDTDIQIYFCDPRSPWQRGTNENTNGLLRQYMPKGADLSGLTDDDLAEIARSLNNRPRKTLEYLKPSEKLAELLAMTD